ncbi:MAG: biotin carboxyl carrier protein [Betaproteobacteria bacterium]|nr:biotin carboxyl carrier protein [Betaproteobacteria bacterium]
MIAPLSISFRFNLFGTEQQAMVEVFWRVMAAAGAQEARMSNPWNDARVWKLRGEAVRAAGVRRIINITYSISPRHNDDYYAERTREAAKLDPYRVCIKDPGGLLTPERTRTLVPLMIANAGGIPLELHTHCTTGLGPLCALEAVEQSIRIVHSAIPPLADDASLPSVFNLAANLRTLGYETGIDEEGLRAVEKHFSTIARREGFPIGRPARYDYAQYVHQVPGGMISNLRSQPREVGQAERLPQVLEEAVRVRAEYGYPIMVTPLSQYVGSQAALNVIAGERYRMVTDHSIRCALGHFGGEVEEIMDPEVRAKILERPRAKELAAIEDKQLTLDEIRRGLDAEALSEEELVLRYALRKEDIERMRAASGPVKEYVTDGDTLVTLVTELAKRAGRNTIRISRPGFSLVLGRGNPGA